MSRYANFLGVNAEQLCVLYSADNGGLHKCIPCEQMILDEAPWVLLWNSGETYALIKPEVKGYELTAMTIPKYRYVYFE